MKVRGEIVNIKKVSGVMGGEDTLEITVRMWGSGELVVTVPLYKSSVYRIGRRFVVEVSPEK